MPVPGAVSIKILLYVFTAGWLIYVIRETDGDLGHPMADYLFTVPLGVWLIHLAIRWAWARRGSGRPRR